MISIFGDVFVLCNFGMQLVPRGKKSHLTCMHLWEVSKNSCAYNSAMYSLPRMCIPYKGEKSLITFHYREEL